ncbi:MAG: DUF3606 domain-containing protein [Bacteroidota bacterium]
MHIDYVARKPKDLSKINLKDYEELLWWSYILRVPPERIIATIEDVGSSAEVVKQALKQKQL